MKNRHVKRPIEKFMKGSVKKESSRIEFERREEDNLETFHMLPYLGIFYLPKFMVMNAVLRNLEYHVFENITMNNDPTVAEHPKYGLIKKCKVIGIGHYMEFNIFNSYHYFINSVCVRANDEVYLEGNILLPDTYFSQREKGVNV